MAPKAKRARERYHVENLKKSTSSFAIYEEEALNIHIQGTNDVSDIFPGYSEVGIDPDLEHLRLGEFDYFRTLVFVPSHHTDLNDGQRRFLMRLRHVLQNSEAEGDDPRFEPYVQAMVDVFLQECKLDDAVHLEILPSMLSMNIAEKKFAAHSDKEGRKDGQLIWVLQESKHKNDTRYKNGEIQLVGALIAACQRNYNKFSGRVLPQAMYGINIKGDELFILRAVFTEGYILSLYEGLPEKALEVKKYPAGVGLRLSSPESRCGILSLMTKLRKYALSIETDALERT